MYAQVTQLFSSAPDLLEDFKQFLPESAAQAKAQAAAARQQQATEEAVMLSNVRGDPYVPSAQHNQSQIPRNELKMPPVGNFAPPPSASKENKKRQGGAGSHKTGGAMAAEASVATIGHNNKNGNLRGNANKVSVAHFEVLKSKNDFQTHLISTLFTKWLLTTAFSHSYFTTWRPKQMSDLVCTLLGKLNNTSQPAHVSCCEIFSKNSMRQSEYLLIIPIASQSGTHQTSLVRNYTSFPESSA